MTKRYRVVIDTNVLISALRSRQGASFALLALVGKGMFDVVLSVPLVLEYEQVAKALKWTGKPAWRHVADILDYLCAVGVPRKVHFLWRPREKDPKDDMVLEVAVAGDCDFILTYNRSDFVDAKTFGIEVITPREFLKRIGELS